MRLFSCIAYRTGLSENSNANVQKLLITSREITGKTGHLIIQSQLIYLDGQRYQQLRCISNKKSHSGCRRMLGGLPLNSDKSDQSFRYRHDEFACQFRSDAYALSCLIATLFLDPELKEVAFC